MEGLFLTGAYFQGWIDRDADAVLQLMGADGTYEDPATRGTDPGRRFQGYMAGLWAAFPDLTFEIASQSKDASSVHWIMHVTNHGSMNGLPPTGRAAEEW